MAMSATLIPVALVPPGSSARIGLKEVHRGNHGGQLYRIPGRSFQDRILAQCADPVNADRIVAQVEHRRQPVGVAIVEGPDSGLPADAIAALKVLVASLAHLETEIGTLDAGVARCARENEVAENEVARRLMTVPGTGPLIATAIAVLVPPSETFRKAHDFAAWLGLTPRQHATRGKRPWASSAAGAPRGHHENGRTVAATCVVSLIRHKQKLPCPGWFQATALISAVPSML